MDFPIYLQAGTTFIGNINRVATCYTSYIKFLTCGNDNLAYEQNCIIFKYVFAKKEHSVSIFFDLEKVYDTTWKYDIQKDLFDMGLRGNLPNFIKR